ncbi:MAG: UvrD-helicase domain-containing protein [Elusimicrobia bacterium]|nr:UvrD-helicase domain-containing protein [Elusimicrobiota bacterium]
MDLSPLNPEQRAAVEHGGGPLLVVAGAGTGKTRVITYRIARLLSEGVPGTRILAVTFTNKAAEEMRTRIEALRPGQGSSVWVHTFHAFAARLLRQHHGALRLPRHFTIYDTDDQKRLISESLKELGLADQRTKAGLYVSVISRAKDDLLDSRSYAIHAMTGTDPFRQTAAKVYERYQEKLDKAGALDFGDLLLKTCELLKGHPQAREYFQELFLHLLVDEYQDTNHSQYIITKTLGAKHRNVCAVGDEDQSVYGWRGANIRNILEFERDFKDARVVKLEQNYRSTPNILAAAGFVIAHNRQRKSKTLWTEKPTGEPVQVHESRNESEEARWVTRRVVELLDQGASLSDVAVFYRTNAQSRSFEEALRMARLPYKVVGAMRFYERKEIKDALAYARVALNGADNVSLSRILNVPARGVGKTSEEALAAYAREHGLTLLETMRGEARIPGLTSACRAACRQLAFIFDQLAKDLDSLPPAAAMSRVLERSGYWTWLENEVETDPEAAGRMGNLQELLNAIKEFEEKNREARLDQYLEGVALQSDADTYERQSAVTLMTVHLAKGLEFPVVFLTGLEEGLFPIGAGNSSPDELEEERRLCYVGMTRARERLILSYASTRRMFGTVYTNLPSRFVLEARLLGAHTGDPEVPAGRVAPATFGSGMPAGSPRPPDPEAAAAGAILSLKVGMRVFHPDFGTGRVTEKSGQGEAMKVTVNFESGKVKKLLVRYARLEPG